MTEDRRFKLVFQVTDADTGECLCEIQQCVMKFSAAELEHLTQNVRDKFPNEPPEIVDKLVAPMHLSWSREIVNAGFLTVATFAKDLILRHLGLLTAEKLLEKMQYKRLM